MAQFDVHQNPIAAARRAYPKVVVLQSSLANAGRDRLVAPLVPKALYPRTAGRLTPMVTLPDGDFVLMIPSLTGIAAADLGEPVATLGAARAEILAAIDYLFFGV